MAASFDYLPNGERVCMAREGQRQPAAAASDYQFLTFFSISVVLVFHA